MFILCIVRVFMRYICVCVPVCVRACVQEITSPCAHKRSHWTSTLISDYCATCNTSTCRMWQYIMKTNVKRLELFKYGLGAISSLQNYYYYQKSIDMVCSKFRPDDSWTITLQDSKLVTSYKKSWSNYCLIYIFKIMSGIAPDYLGEYFSLASSVHGFFAKFQDNGSYTFPKVKGFWKKSFSFLCFLWLWCT